jgi:WS/DGAT/MGAT family acyltransferase
MPDRLSGLDASFLHFERDGAHMHVGLLCALEGPAPSPTEFREHVASRLHLLPRLRQKLGFVPFEQGRPVWVDDPDFDLEYHVRQAALPDPGSDEQLCSFASRIFSKQLDRGRPLWEIWLVEGLRDGRFAIIFKIHHALTDGASSAIIAATFFDLDPQPAEPPASPPPWLPRPEPSGRELLAESLRARVDGSKRIGRGLRGALRAPNQVVRGLGSISKTIEAGASASLHPVFNAEIGEHRRFAIVQADLADFKRVKDTHGGTVNDVILSVVAGALGRYLRSHGHDTDGLELRALVPISTRAAEDYGTLGNQVTGMMAPLPVWSEDPIERLNVVTEQTRDLKSSGEADGAEILAKLTDYVPGAIASRAARLQPAQRFYNLVVTNATGPQFPLYVLGRKLEATFGVTLLSRRQALAIAIASYDGQVNFGMLGDYDAMADLDSFGLDVEAAIAEVVATVPAKSGRRAAANASPNGIHLVASEPS